MLQHLRLKAAIFVFNYDILQLLLSLFTIYCNIFSIGGIVIVFILYFLASPDALEVIVVTYSLTHLLTYSLSISTDLSDVTLVSDDTY